MYNVNKIYFTGKIVHLNDIHEFSKKDGTVGRVLNFRVRCEYAFGKSKNFFCVAWGDDAAKIARKGQNAHLGIFGTSTTESYKKDGQWKYADKIVVSAFGPADVCPTSLS